MDVAVRDGVTRTAAPNPGWESSHGEEMANRESEDDSMSGGREDFHQKRGDIR